MGKIQDVNSKELDLEIEIAAEKEEEAEKVIPSIQPSLFGIKHSSRDFTKADAWGKNKFNSAFPASLVAYMGHIGVPCVYLKLGPKGTLVKEEIESSKLFGVDPTSDDLFYSFEKSYEPYKDYVTDNQTPKVDLMLSNRHTDEIYSGFEIKLTTLPDESTHHLPENQWGCELVIRTPSIIFLACSIAHIYNGRHRDLQKYFGKGGFGNVANYKEAVQVNPILPQMAEILHSIFEDNLSNQKPAIIQPIWKTKGKTANIDDNCLDVFVWSELAFTKLFLKTEYSIPADPTSNIDRPSRAVIHLFFMIYNFAMSGKFDPKMIFQELSYKTKNDKAFSTSGRVTTLLMGGAELTKPRITKEHIKNIIQNGGEKMLSPERRFDAVLVNSSDIFDRL